jgi:oxygen-independent coproporphyrinogen-3 oxidase
MTTDDSDLQCSAAQETVEPLVGNYFVATYPPFSCWTQKDATEVQRALDHPRDAGDDAPFCLYIHVPFCVERCHYCYYRSYSEVSRAQTDRYLDAILKEVTRYGAQPALSGRRPGVLYFGGGTPSILTADQITRLTQGIEDVFPRRDPCEITFECAPKSVNEAKLDALSAAGVTRISMGVQQLDDEVLARNGRVHKVRDVERAYAAIRHTGFDTVNIDLMVGLIGETDESFFESLRRVIAMGPDTVTLYLMEIPPNTPLYHALEEGSMTEQPASWATKRDRLTKAFEQLETEGYTVRTAYAAVRDPQRDRFRYQEDQYHGADLLGLGVASFSYLAGVHHQNQASLDKYLSSLAADELPLARAHPLTDEERMVREFVLQLKLGRVETGRFQDKFAVNVLERFADPLARLQSEGMLSVSPVEIALTRRGLVRVDRLLAEFYLSQHSGSTYW